MAFLAAVWSCILINSRIINCSAAKERTSLADMEPVAAILLKFKLSLSDTGEGTADPS